VKFLIKRRTAIFSVITGLLAVTLVMTMGIQTVSARELPAQAGEQDKQTNTNCGGGEEVRSAFPQYGTETGILTGQLNSQTEDHKTLNQDWAAIAGSCGQGK
jgi:hypothetical protein